MPIEGMMNLYKYIDVIERKVIPDMRKAFLDGGGNSNRYCLMSFIWKSEDDFQEAKLNVLD